MFIFPGMGHAIFHETGRAQVFERVRAFLDRQFAKPAGDALPAVMAYTRREYERLAKPLPAYCPKNAAFKVQRLGLKTFCKLSDGRAPRLADGVRFGAIAGLHLSQSGRRNDADREAGRLFLSERDRMRGFGSVGFTWIRRCGRQLTLHWRGRDVRGVVDIAAGPGRYVLEMLASMPKADVSAVLRDRSVGGLEEGRATGRAVEGGERPV